MGLKFENSSETQASPACIREALDRLLASEQFQKSPVLSRLLTFLVEHQVSGDGDLKETLVGHTLYGRSLTYDPKADSVVRVNANRLRMRLSRYYLEHPEETLRIELRPGSYVPVFLTVPKAPAPALRLVGKTQDASVEDVTETLPPPLPVPVDVVPQKPAGRRKILLTVVVLFAVISILLIVRFLSRHHPQSEDAWALEHVSSLGGEEEFPTLSPDGNTLAFSWRGPKDKAAHVYFHDMSTGSVRRLTSQAPEENRPAWNPDGSQIAFIRLRGNVPSKDVILYSLRDGKERKLTELTGAYPWLCQLPRLSWSKDGKTLYSAASLASEQACSIVAIDAERGNVRRITQPPIGTVGDLEPAVAPDGSGIAFLRNVGEMGGDIFFVRPATGAVERLTEDNRDIMGFAWMPKVNALILASRRDNGVSRLWQMQPGSRKARVLTDGSMAAGFPSLAKEGDRIFFTAYRGSASIWGLKNGALRELIDSPGVNHAPQLSPDGTRLVYRSDRTGAAELWMSRLDGTNDVRLTFFNGPMVASPRWSPDGSAILFECRPKGQSQICLVHPDGKGGPQILTHWSANQTYPSWSHDGRSFYFTSNDSGRWEIYRQAFGGTPEQLTHGGGQRALESPRGDWLYISKGEPQGGIERLALPFATVAPEPVKTDVGPWGAGLWDVSNDGLIYVSGTSVRDVNGDTGQTQELETLRQAPPVGDLVFSYAASTGEILFVQGERHDGEINMLQRRLQ